MDTDFQLFQGMARAKTGFAVKIDQRSKPAVFTANDRDHQRQSQRAGSSKRGRCSPDAEPHWQRVLHRSRIHSFTVQRRAMFTRPVDMRVLTNLKEQVELFGEKRIVVLQ